MKEHTMTTESKPKPVYKKTSRTRAVAGHSKLDIVRDGLERNLALVLDKTVMVSVTRSQEQRYARALFDVAIDNIIINGRTAEEVLQLAEGVKIVSDLKEAA